MNDEEANEILQVHANLKLPIIESSKGFLSSLKMFKGLNDKHLDEIMEALKVLSDSINYKTINGEVVKNIYNIIFWTRSWTARRGMLERNNSLNSEEREQLIWWIEIIEEAFYYLLNEDTEEAFFCYEEYLDGRRH